MMCADVYVNERLQRVDRNWPYFLGFGLPIYLAAVPTTRRLMQCLSLPTPVEAPIAYFFSSVVFPLAILAAATSDRERRWQLRCVVFAFSSLCYPVAAFNTLSHNLLHTCTLPMHILMSIYNLRGVRYSYSSVLDLFQRHII